jgi:hypothetical protein
MHFSILHKTNKVVYDLTQQGGNMWFKLAIAYSGLTVVVLAGVIGFCATMQLGAHTFWNEQFQFRTGTRIFWFLYAIGVGFLSSTFTHSALTWARSRYTITKPLPNKTNPAP